jgi:hypothetical protein
MGRQNPEGGGVLERLVLVFDANQTVPLGKVAPVMYCITLLGNEGTKIRSRARRLLLLVFDCRLWKAILHSNSGSAFEGMTITTPLRTNSGLDCCRVQ